MSDNVVQFPAPIVRHSFGDLSMLAEAATSARSAAETMLKDNPTAEDMERAMSLLNEAWGVCAAYFIFQMGEF